MGSTDRETTDNRIGLIGAGNMGAPMLRYLLAGGHRVQAYDVSEPAREAARKLGADIAEDAAEVRRECDVIFLSLPNVAALEQVCAAFEDASQAPAIVIETSTLPLSAKEQARDRLSANGVIMLDAPLSGTGAQAANRDIAILASGDRSAFDRVLPYLECVSRAPHYLGPFGDGMRMKLLANHLVAIHSLAAAEVVRFAIRIGIDPTLAINVLNTGAGASRMLAVRGPEMVAGDFDQPKAHLGILLKDIGYIEMLAAESDVSLPLFSRAAEVFKKAGDMGWARRDTSELFYFLDVLDGLPPSSDDAV